MSRWGSSILAAAAVLALVACGPSNQDKAVHPRANPRETHVTLKPPAVAEPKQKHPNVLVIEADDMRWDDLRFMPNVQRLLQRRGLTFENSFAPYPLCCPSRASFLTGQYAHNHHVYSHVDPFGFAAFHDQRTIATVLQKAGYQTALVGKYLNGYGDQPLRSTGGSSLHYEPPGWTEWMAGSDHRWQPGDPFQGGTYAYFNLTQNVNGEIKSFPGRYSTGVLGAQTRGLVSRFGAGQSALVHLVDARGAAPRLTDRVRRPACHPSDRRTDNHVGDPGPTRLGQGPLRQPDQARLRNSGHGVGRGGRERQAPLPAQASRAHPAGT